MNRLILASASKRRFDLLNQIGINPHLVEPSNIDEALTKGEAPSVYASRISKQKALKIAEKYQDCYILSGDTIVISGGKIIPKAETDKDVKEALVKLSGKSHNVLTCICLISPDGRTIQKNVYTKVKLKNLTKDEISHYIESGEGIGKAGGYAIQGAAAAFIKSINGSYTSVVGLPLYEVVNILTGVGFFNDK